MIRATSRNSLRTASDVKRGVGSGAAIDGGGVKPGAARPSATCFDARRARLRRFELELIELFVQRADLLLVCAANMSSSRLDAVGVRRAGVEHRLEVGHPRAQSIEVVLGLVGTDEGSHRGRGARLTTARRLVEPRHGSSSGDERDEAEGQRGQRQRFVYLDGGGQVAPHLRVLPHAIRVTRIIAGPQIEGEAAVEGAHGQRAGDVVRGERHPRAT